jgi:hypothetical protein
MSSVLSRSRRYRLRPSRPLVMPVSTTIAKHCSPLLGNLLRTPISSAKAAPSKNQPDAVNSAKADPIGALEKLAEFCCANLPRSFAPSILPVQVAELRSSIAIINEWLSRFARALDDLEATNVVLNAAEAKQAPDIVTRAKHEPLPAGLDLWSDLDIPPFLDRRPRLGIPPTVPGPKNGTSIYISEDGEAA